MPMAYTDFLDVLDCRLHPDAAPLWDALYHLSKNSHQNDNDKIRKRNAVLIDILETWPMRTPDQILRRQKKYHRRRRMRLASIGQKEMLACYYSLV